MIKIDKNKVDRRKIKVKNPEENIIVKTNANTSCRVC